jgi:hypothetical protein
MSAEIWADRDSLRWPAGITCTDQTVIGADDPRLRYLKVHDAGADLATFQGAEVEWTLRLRADDVVELVDRRVVGVRGV